ncbi:GCN5-related N-acetyltransferase [Candidatus Vecturithrix granuli]|uniref:GCN5-related N-acetyltransferase n=1 Tax=Vecturithrix granuli TaxID=1499967 RepID=A0A081C5S4_VECG1|nr:GCN5-related N-acetyltransferase [Candidatus Vecturithrix granuli]
MAIRKWQEQDLPQIIALLQELNEALGEDQEIDDSTVREHYVNMNEQPEVYENYVFEDNGMVAGFLSLLFYRTIYHKRGTALINELIVSKAYRNQKIGEQLLQYGMNAARERGMDEIEVGVMQDNIGAIKFYKKHGITEEYVLLGMEFGQ